MDRPNDQSPQIPDGQVYDGSQSHYEEEAPKESGPQPHPQYEDISMDEEEEELLEDQRGAQSLPVAPREAMGIGASPAACAPQSPRYIRDSEDEGALVALEISCQIMAQNLKTDCLKKWPRS